MSDVTLDHFKRAAADIGAHGDNDTLPFDIDNRFIKDTQDDLAKLGFEYFSEVNNKDRNDTAKTINALQIFSERLLVLLALLDFVSQQSFIPFGIYILMALVSL